jgi:hypothetical protein
MSTTYPGALGALLLTFLPLMAEEAAAQVGITLQWIYPVETVYVSDFIPRPGGQNPDFVSITLMESTGRDQQVTLELSIAMEQPDPGLLFRGITDPFVLRGVRRITNRELTGRGSDVSFQDYDVGTDNEAILQTGTLPSGTYLVRAVVRSAQGVELDQDEVTLTLGNPTRVELLAPGRPVGEPPPLVSTPSPRFLWSADGSITGAGFASYTLRVARADGASSGEEAMQGFASWQTVLSQTSTLYPGSAQALPLEPGGTYAWQVTREVRTSGGVERLESPIYWFRMGTGGMAQSGAGRSLLSGANQAVAMRLSELFRAIGLAEELAGFSTVTGVLVDGRAVPVTGVAELLAAIAAGEITIKSIRVR